MGIKIDGISGVKPLTLSYCEESQFEDTVEP